MNTNSLRKLLIISLCLNIGVLAALGWHYWSESTNTATSLPAYLQLDAEQEQQWQQIEQPFLTQFGEAATKIAHHRNAMIDAIFSEPTNRTAIETERDAIALLQEHQQQLLIEQLLREREMLSAEQRQLLLGLLKQDQIPVSAVEQLHQH